MRTSLERVPAAAGTEIPAAVRRRRGSRRSAVVLAGLLGLLILSCSLAVTIGPADISITTAWRVVLHHALPGGIVSDHGVSAAHDEIVWGLRLPRVVLGAVVGAGLAIVGAVLQAIVRNPLADPYVFGITSGASVGATAVIVFDLVLFGVYSISLAAFLGALLAFSLVLLLAGRGTRVTSIRLILAGVAVAYTMSAVSSAMLYFGANQESDAGAAQQVLFWLLGGLASASWDGLGPPTIAVTLGVALTLWQARVLDAVAFGDESATTLGIDPARFRRRAFALAALMTGAMVAVSGGIGFVGLVLPHVARRLVGPSHRRLLPTSAVLGAIFLVWADVLARTVAAPQEIPIGVVTALFGAPFFALILRSSGWRSG